MTKQVKLSAVSVRFMHGRNIVMCVPRDPDTNLVIGPEQPLSQALELVKAGFTITNSQEVLECIVKQYGFGA